MGCGASSYESANFEASSPLVLQRTPPNFLCHLKLLQDDSVESLDLSCFNARAAEAMRNNRDNTPLPDAKYRLDLIKLSEYLPNAKKLQTLYLNQNRISTQTEDGKVLLQSLSKVPNLNELHLSKNPIGDHGVSLVFESGPNDPTFFARMRVLDLGSTSVTNLTLELLCRQAQSALKQQKEIQLSRLSLAFNPDLTSDVLLPSLAVIVECCPKLEWISLASCTGLTDFEKKHGKSAYNDELKPLGTEEDEKTEEESSLAETCKEADSEEKVIQVLVDAIRKHSTLKSIIMFGTNLPRTIQSLICRAIGDREILANSPIE